MKKRRNRSKSIPHAARHRHLVPREQAFQACLASIPPPLRQAAAAAARQTTQCLLCREPAAMIGVFFPFAPTAWGIPHGWHAARVYGLCESCRARPDCLACVEADIWQHRATWAAKAVAFRH
jgi:hypothetical protein